MNQPIYLRLAIPTPLRQAFDYLPPKDSVINKLEPGMRVIVPFGRRQRVVGILLEVVNKPQIDPKKLKYAIEIVDQSSLIPPDLFQLLQWTADYYHHPIGEVFSQSLPQSLAKGKDVQLLIEEMTVNIDQQSEVIQPHANPPTLTPAQSIAIDKIKQHKQYQAFLLHGVTGSGKTEVYLNIIEEILKQGKQALVLIPEISLTPQTVARFTQRFNVDIAVLHSGLTPKQRLIAWLKAKLGISRIIIGTRSAIFTAIKHLGVIIIDEEHDLSYKQQSGLRYSAKDLAIVRCQQNNIPIILGSATPSLESLINVKRKKFIQLSLPERTANAKQPTMNIIDIRNLSLDQGLSSPLIRAIQQHVVQNNQVLIFLNRRGYAPSMLCHRCGERVSCHRCDVNMTLHHNPKRLICHHCNSVKQIPKRCSHCQSNSIIPVGVGTARLEQALLHYFPNANPIRIDRDTTKRKGAMNKLLDDIHSGEHQILVGTQMLAKGHHFPNVTMVAIIDADSGLYSTDFRACERMGQLLIQVAGRAGRAEKAGEVYIQTHNPDHAFLQLLMQQNYLKFANAVAKERHISHLPPYSYMALFTAESINKQHPFTFLNSLREFATELNIEQVAPFGPVPSTIARKANHYRAQLLLHSKTRQSLHHVLKKLLSNINQINLAKKIRWSLDIDPLEIG